MFCPFCEIPMTYMGGGFYQGVEVEDYFCPLCGFEWEEEYP
jgi:transposase-like protein